MEKKNHNSPNDSCGLFDFMANSVGIKVLHPGGYKATEKLCSMSNISNNSNVLDIACGTGTTSFFINKKYNANVTGIDISEYLIGIANNKLSKDKTQNKIKFELGNALKLPYKNNTFDFVISQAFFILIDDKEKALKEIYRVLKPGGHFGSLELGWFTKPSKEAYSKLYENTCKDFIPRVVLFEEWENFFISEDLKHLATTKNPMQGGMMKMLKAEGLVNFLKIMKYMITNPYDRKRMMKIQNTFDKYNNYLGYGLFSFVK